MSYVRIYTHTCLARGTSILKLAKADLIVIPLPSAAQIPALSGARVLSYPWQDPHNGVYGEQHGVASVSVGLEAPGAASSRRLGSLLEGGDALVLLEDFANERAVEVDTHFTLV